MANITYDELDKIIDEEPQVRVISSGDIVTCITCDEFGVVCESDYGVEDYEYDEIEKINGDLSNE